MIPAAQFTTAMERAAVATSAQTGGDVEVLSDYSGRHMKGRTCIAVTLPTNSSVTLFAMNLTLEIRNLSDDQYDPNELARELKRACFDDKGLGRIAYYPDRQYTRSEGAPQ